MRRNLLLLGVIITGVICILMYWAQHLYYSASEEELDKKIRILEWANKTNPFNDLVLYELGKAYFSKGTSFGDAEPENETYLQKAVSLYKKSIHINPASHFSHFHLARSLFYLDLLSVPSDLDYYEEYRKAANLVSFNSQIYFEVGKLFFSAWHELSENDKEFTLDMIREICRTKDREKILSILKIWEMNVKDYETVRDFLPEDPDTYKIYADFLGGNSLDLKERLEILTKYELLQFGRAKETFESGENSYFYYRVQDAFNKFSACLRILDRIKFYQNFSEQFSISRTEFSELKRNTYLYLAKSLIEGGQEWDKYKDYLQAYLNYDLKVSEVNDLENYLHSRAVLKDDAVENISDLGRFLFQMHLYFKQNRYRDIMRSGQSFQRGIVSLSEDENEMLVAILQVIGDSYQKSGSLYDAGDIYRKALEIDPDDLITLLKLHENLELLNDENMILNVETRIERSLSPQRIDRAEILISKGRSLPQALLLDGRGIILNFQFENDLEDRSPLVAVFFNNEVVWEDYLLKNNLSIALESNVGKNVIEIIPINMSVKLKSLIWENDT